MKNMNGKRVKSSRPTTVHSGHFQWRQWRLGYECYGEEDAAPCLLVHGILLDSHIYRDVALRVAAAGYRVMLLDLLGHGRSDKPTQATEYRVDFFADQMLAALDHMGWDRALVGGLSLGAISALQLAVLAPERLNGLFIEMPVMEYSTPTAALLLVPPLLATYYGAGLYRRMARLLRRLPRPRSEWLTSVINALSQEPEVISAILHGTLVGPVVPPRAQRESIATPTLIIGHGGDWLHNLRDARALARQIPDSTLLRARSILEMRRKPDRLWPEIHQFLQSVHPGNSAVSRRRAKPVNQSTTRQASSARGKSNARKRPS